MSGGNRAALSGRFLCAAGNLHFRMIRRTCSTLWCVLPFSIILHRRSAGCIRMYQALYRKYRPKNFDGGRRTRAHHFGAQAGDCQRTHRSRLSLHRLPRHRQDLLLQKSSQGGQLSPSGGRQSCRVCDICRGIDDSSILASPGLTLPATAAWTTSASCARRQTSPAVSQTTAFTSSTKPICSAPAPSTLCSKSWRRPPEASSSSWRPPRSTRFRYHPLPLPAV